MIDGTRRGYMIGSEVGAILSSSVVRDTDVQALAHWQYRWLQGMGIAHLEPRDGFVESFLDGFRSASSKGKGQTDVN